MCDKFTNGTQCNAIIGKNVFNSMLLQYKITDEQKYIQNANENIRSLNLFVRIFEFHVRVTLVSKFRCFVKQLVIKTYVVVEVRSYAF